MGYYTELKLSVQLNREAPLDVLENLADGSMWEIITGSEIPSIHSVQDTPNLPIDHEFGKTHRWTQIFHGAKFNKARKTLKIECDIKAYEDDYEKLVDWLKPYIISGRAKYKGEDMDNWIKLL